MVGKGRSEGLYVGVGMRGLDLIREWQGTHAYKSAFSAELPRKLVAFPSLTCLISRTSKLKS